MALRSQYDCSHCGNAIEKVAPVCPHCDRLTEFPDNLSAFEVLGVDESLKVDLEALRSRFYELSKLTHPDRFQAQDPKTQLVAGRWSTAINRAYQTIRNPILRAEHLLEQSGKAADSKAQVPLELAETYFDLQDALGEPGADAQLLRFRNELEEKQAQWDADWQALENSWPGADPLARLDDVKKHLTMKRFLTSMIADVDRKLGTEAGAAQ